MPRGIYFLIKSRHSPPITASSGFGRRNARRSGKVLAFNRRTSKSSPTCRRNGEMNSQAAGSRSSSKTRRRSQPHWKRISCRSWPGKNLKQEKFQKRQRQLTRLSPSPASRLELFVLASRFIFSSTATHFQGRAALPRRQLEFKLQLATGEENSSA